MRKLRLVVVFTLSLIPATLLAQQSAPSAAEFHDQIQKLYGFHPAEVTAAERTEKSNLMDALWNKAKAQPTVYVPLLRREVQDFSNPPFFLFDGSQLLLSLSKDPADGKIVSAALPHVDLRDAQPSGYFYLVHELASAGIDTTDAALNILSEPKFKVFVPEHAMALAQADCLVFMLLPTNQTFWLQPAIERLKKESDPTAQQSLLLVLWYAQTAASDKAILDFANDAAKPAASTKFANELMKRKGDAKPAKKTDTEESLRQARAERMKAVSDEALYDLDSYTSQIMAKRKAAEKER